MNSPISKAPGSFPSSQLLFSLIFAFLLVSCGENGTTADASSTSLSEPEPDLILHDSLDLSASSVEWNRVLDQKATKKKMKLFGAEVEVEVDAMKMEMNGNVSPTSGIFTTTNGEPTGGHLKFDMATFKFAEEKGQGLFDVKNYPESELKFESFGPAEAGDSLHTHMVSMTLTIQGTTRDISAPVTIETADTGSSIKGEFSFNTLDFPLRDPNTQATVNKDEITVQMNLSYKR